VATSATGIEAARELDGLYRVHAAEVFRYAYAVLGNRADAEDVTQTTFVNALRALERGERPHTPKNWLITIAHNLIRQRFRQLQARPREVELDHELPAFEPADEGPSIDDLVRALQRIPPTQRQALVLRELEGRSYVEIGALLDVSQSALETLIFRARRSLAEELENLVTCDAAELALSRATDGRLGRKERRRLLAHLNECTSCARIAARGIKRRRAFKALAVLPLPFSLTLFKGAPSASAAAGLPTIGAAAGAGGAAGTAAGIGATGVTAKIAVGLAAVAVAGGAGYEGVKTVDGPPPAARAAKVEHIAATAVVGRAEATPAVAIVPPRGPSRRAEAKATVKPPKEKPAKAKLVKPKVAKATPAKLKATPAKLTAAHTAPKRRGESAAAPGRMTPATTPKTRPDRTSGPQRRAKAKPETTKPAKPTRSQQTPTQKPKPVKPPRTAEAEKAAKTEKPAKAEKPEPVAGPIGSAKPDKPR
jgi:RNA polymerase sigma factor (sigma-70 family)